MQHLGAKVRQLHRLAIRHVLQQPCARHQTRIGRVKPIDVLPDAEHLAAQQVGEERRREVRAIAPERRVHGACWRRRHVAGRHDVIDARATVTIVLAVASGQQMRRDPIAHQLLTLGLAHVGRRIAGSSRSSLDHKHLSSIEA